MALQSISQLVDGILGTSPKQKGTSLASNLSIPMPMPNNSPVQPPATDLGSLGMIGVQQAPNGQASPITGAVPQTSPQPQVQPAMQQKGALNPWGIAGQIIGGQGQVRLSPGQQPTSMGRGVSNLTHRILGIGPSADNQVSDNADDDALWSGN